MKKYIFIVLMLIIPTWSILVQKGYYPIHDDLQTMRQLQMNKCFEDRQIPCRWIVDMGLGYGFPLFNYYPPLPYLIGQPLVSLGVSYVDTVKIVGALGFVAAALAMYLFAREFVGDRGGVVAAVFYSYAPYRATNFYVRAAVNEFWASVFFPLILWAIYKIVTTRSLKWGVVFSLSLVGLVLSHNQMLMIFAPLMALWAGFWWLENRSVKPVIMLGGFSLLSLGLSAFYLLPVLLEKSYAHLETLVIGYFNYLAHFLDLKQMFLKINWGYGGSTIGPEDTMSFAVGYAHWIVPVAIGVGLLILPRLKRYWGILSIFFLFTGIYLFMAHSRSTFVWKLIPPLEYLQFPWRFLSVAMFTTSFLAAFAAFLLPRKFIPVLIVIVLALNASYFHPKLWLPNVTDQTEFSGVSWRHAIGASIFDYLPKGAPQPPAGPSTSDLTLLFGTGQVATIEKRTNIQQYQVHVDSPGATAQIETYYFPGWQVFVDDQPVVIDTTGDTELGRMRVPVSAGDHTIIARFTNTPVRSFSNALTGVSSLILIGIILLWFRQKQRLVMQS